jgi:hypothetical protein
MDREEKLYRMFGKFYPQGTILFSENDSAEEMFYIQSGRLRVTGREGAEGPAQTMDVGPGELLGEDSFTGGGERRTMAEALEDSRLLVIDPGNVESVVRNGPELAEVIVQMLLDSLRTTWVSLHRWQCAHAWERVRAQVEMEGKSGSWASGEVSAAIGVEEYAVRMILDTMAQAGGVASEGGSYTLRDAALLSKPPPADVTPTGTTGGR